jgi:hypothetical protein
MAKREWTEEQKQALREKMIAGKAAAAAKREAKAAEAEAAPAAPSPAADPEASAARRRRLLADVPAEMAALITDAELAEIERDEAEKALAEQRKKALTDIRAMARQYARIEHDLVPASVLRSEDERRRLAEPVKILVNMPEGGGALGFRVDGRLLQNGEIVTVSRAVYESLAYTHYKAHLNEVTFSTLDQHKPRNSAAEVLSRRRPTLEILDAA